MNRITITICCLLLVGGLFWLFPLFHVVRINTVEGDTGRSSFNAADFAKSFWSDRLVPSLSRAADAGTVLAVSRSGPKEAREKFGRKVGVSRMRLVVLQGSGTIVTLDKNGVGVALAADANEPDIILQTRLLFGNTVRDATGLLDASDFPNSQHFNDVSVELNRIVEERVISVLKEKAAVGQQIDFAGCAEIADEARILKSLPVIPLDVTVK
jgi:predicted lipoprotein